MYGGILGCISSITLYGCADNEVVTNQSQGGTSSFEPEPKLTALVQNVPDLVALLGTTSATSYLMNLCQPQAVVEGQSGISDKLENVSNTHLLVSKRVISVIVTRFSPALDEFLNTKTKYRYWLVRLIGFARSLSNESLFDSAVSKLEIDTTKTTMFMLGIYHMLTDHLIFDKKPVSSIVTHAIECVAQHHEDSDRPKLTGSLSDSFQEIYKKIVYSTDVPESFQLYQAVVFEASNILLNDREHFSYEHRSIVVHFFNVIYEYLKEYKYQVILKKFVGEFMTQVREQMGPEVVTKIIQFVLDLYTSMKS